MGNVNLFKRMTYQQERLARATMPVVRTLQQAPTLKVSVEKHHVWRAGVKGAYWTPKGGRVC